MNRASFHTLGCKLNHAETSTLARDFRTRGFETVPFGETAEVTVINTCTVTDEAEKKCRNAIRRALRANPDTFVLVTGCYAQLRPDEIAAIPGVDVVLGSQEKFRLFDLIESFSKVEKTQISVSCIDETAQFGPAYSLGDRTRTFLKIQDGCDYSCSFCTIPMARGKSRSQTIERTVDQAREIAARGIREIVLSGVNIGLFGQERDENLLSLLHELDKVEGIDRYRISSIEPNLLTKEIISFTAQSARFQPHFHIPLQSGDNGVLGKMRRRYKRELYADRVRGILDSHPDASIGVDVIVGFPAETDEAFENTFAFLQELPVAYLHVFSYSERPDTAAIDADKFFGISVPKPVRRERSKRLRLLSTRKRHDFYARFLGTTRPVLWESSEKDGLMTGFTDNYIKVSAPFDDTRSNQVEDVFLESLGPHGTVASGTNFHSLDIISH